jgi:transcriptional regulator with XRE-family HTH domain
MPLSVRRHNLAPLRESLSLTQSEFAKLIGRSFSTIKSIEAGSLKLSSQLATLIADATGADRGWLLRNDPSEPMPPLKIPGAWFQPENRAHEFYCILLRHLFDRLFRALSRVQAGKSRDWLQTFIKVMLDDEISIGYDPDGTGRLLDPIRPGFLDFFRKHPEFLDPELARWINLKFLIKDAYTVAKESEAPSETVAKPATPADPLAGADEAFEDAMKEPRFAQAVAEVETYFAQEPAKPRRRKAPSQTQASPAPGGQRKSPRSSASRRAASPN